MERFLRVSILLLLCLPSFPLALYAQAPAVVSEQAAPPMPSVAAGTALPYLVQDINPGAPGAGPKELVALGDQLLFVANNGASGAELWKSNGAAGGTTLVKEIAPGAASPAIEQMVVVGNTLFFLANPSAHAIELWKSDGTAAGTVLVKTLDQDPATTHPQWLTAVGNTLFFVAANGSGGNELWKSNGTAAGTMLVKDIYPGTTSSRPHSLTAVGNTLYFLADDGSSGDDLWQSNGTAAGTVRVGDPSLDPNSRATGLTAVGSTLFFEVYRIANQRQLWKSDGTAAGTQLVKVIGEEQDDLVPFQMQVVGNRLFFVANDYQFYNGELWVSDGTAAGTMRINRVSPGNYTELTAVGNTLFYVAGRDGNGTELWKSDGSAAGTTLVKDIKANGGSFPGSLMAAGDKLFFYADDGQYGAELWVSDGTVAGTNLVQDLWPGANASYPFAGPVVGETFFFTAEDGSHGRELWALALTPSADRTVLLSTTQNGTIGSLAYRDEDILAYQPATNAWALVFDGSDVGLGNVDVDAFAFLPNGQLLLSVDKDFNLANFGQVDDADILAFAPTALGPVTAGTFTRYFDGSDVGLNTSGEDVDAVDIGVQNVLRISVTGAFQAPGPGGNTTGGDEDLYRFRADSVGEATTGDFAVLFDGSDVGLTTASEDVRDTWTDSNEDIYLVTLGKFKVDGVSGDGNDIFICHPTSFGATTACQFRFYWDGSAAGLGKNLIDGLHLGALPSLVNAAASDTGVNPLDDTLYAEGDDAEEADELDGEETASEEESAPATQLYLPLITR